MARLDAYYLPSVDALPVSRKLAKRLHAFRRSSGSVFESNVLGADCWLGK